MIDFGDLRLRCVPDVYRRGGVFGPALAKARPLEDVAELRELKRRNKLLEQENEIHVR